MIIKTVYTSNEAKRVIDWEALILLLIGVLTVLYMTWHLGRYYEYQHREEVTCNDEV